MKIAVHPWMEEITRKADAGAPKEILPGVKPTHALLNHALSQSEIIIIGYATLTAWVGDDQASALVQFKPGSGPEKLLLRRSLLLPLTGAPATFETISAEEYQALYSNNSETRTSPRKFRTTPLVK